MGQARRRMLAPLLMALLASLIGPGATGAVPPKIATTLSVTSSPNPAWVGETVTFTFTVSPMPDGGYVSRGGADQYPVDPATGRATFAQPYPSAGMYEFQAWYSGTNAYAGSPPITASTVVQQHPVTATLTVPASPVGRGDTFDVLVDLDEGPPDGTVLIQDMTNGNPGPTIASAPVSGLMPMTIHVGGMDPGSYVIRANFTGTAAYAADTTASQALTVFDRPTTTAASLATDPTNWGAGTTVNVVISPVPDDGGGVKVRRDGSDQGFATMDWSTGRGTFALAPTDPGAHTITVEYTPGSWPYRYGLSSTSIAQTVLNAPLDADPPVATMVINGDDPVTTEGYVVLSIHASDASNPMSIRLSCDGGVTWDQGAVTDGDQGYSVAQNQCPGEGLKTVTAEIKDAYGNTTLVSDTITLEHDGPIGTIILADGSMISIWPTVTIAVAATDAGSGVAEVALSNDNATWTYRVYAPTQPWQLSPGDGAKTVYSKWRDGYGHWSDVTSDTIILDTVAPAATAPVARLAIGAALSGGRTPVSIFWTAGDATSGLDHTLIRQQTDGGAWSAAARVTGIATSRLLVPGHTFRFQIQAVDQAGNSGAWVAGSTLRLGGVSQASSAVRYGGTWATSTSATTWWGGTAKYATRAGATASYTFTGRSIAWVGLKATTRGRAQIYVNGVLKATVDLASATTLRQRIVWAANFTTAATRTITIKVIGTSGRPRVDIDGFIVAT